MAKHSTINVASATKNVIRFIQINLLRVGDAMNVQTEKSEFLSGEEYARLWGERRERIIKRTGKRTFTMKEYSDLINEDIEINGDPVEDARSKKVKESDEIKDNDSNPERPDSKAVIVDPFESDAPVGARQSDEPLNVCVSCEG